MAARKPVPEPFDIVTVTWEDAYIEGASSGLSYEDAIKAYNPTITKTTGLYVGWADRKGRTALVVSTDINTPRYPGEDPYFGGPIYIPKGMVIEVLVIAKGSRLSPSPPCPPK